MNTLDGKELSLANQCYEKLQEHILNGTFAPGQKLKVDALKQEFAIGHSPIREALSRLVSSGLVESRENKGFRVAQVSQADIYDVYQTFFHIELLALTQAIKHGDDAWESRVVAALHHLALVETKNEPVEYQVWAERNYAFHVALISGCNSPLLMQIRADVYLRFDRYCRIAFHSARKDLMVNHAEHKELAETVLSRNLEKTEKLIRYHIFGAQEAVIDTLKKNNFI